ncbi:MAG: hypothetical protein ACE15E_16060 [Acidobacteriota bacterium]
MTQSKVIRKAVLFFFVSNFLSHWPRAEQLYGVLTGRITVASPVTITDLELTVVNPQTEYSRPARIQETGWYDVPGLLNGTYSLQIGSSRFGYCVTENVPVTAGEVTRLDLSLDVAPRSQLRCTADFSAVRLKTETADLSAQLESQELSALPLGFLRNYQSLLVLVPGVTPLERADDMTDSTGLSLAVHVNGAPRNGNTVRVDGAPNANIWLPRHAAYIPPADTIEVINVSTNNFDAEQGFAAGSAISVLTRSGTNELHGSLLGYHENSALNARNFFNYLDTDNDGKADKPGGQRSIGSATFAGPLAKDKFFFFLGWEGAFQRQARTSTATVPTQEQRNGDFSDFATIIYDPLTGKKDGTGRAAFENNVIPANRLSAEAKAAQSLLPLPNLKDPVTDDYLSTNNYQASSSEKLNRNNVDLKLNWLRKPYHSVWGKFGGMKANVTRDPIFGEGGGGAIGGGADGEENTRLYVASLGHTWTLSPNLLMDGHTSYTGLRQRVENADFDKGDYGQETLDIPGTNNTQDGACIVDGVDRCGGVPAFHVPGFNSFGQVTDGSPLFRDEDTFTASQNFSWTRGTHQLRWGYELIHYRLEHWQAGVGGSPRGSFIFSRETTGAPGQSVTDQNAWAAFLLGYPTAMSKGLQWELMTAREWQHALYLGDRWHASPRLTLSLGLRFEYYPLLTRANRSMEYLNLDSFAVRFDNNIKVKTPLLAPRLGVAYRPGTSDVIRAGYGIAYNPLPLAGPLRGSYPLIVGGQWESPSAHFPLTVLEEGIPLSFEGPDLEDQESVPLPSNVAQRTLPSDELNRPYTQSWNLFYERRLPGELVASVGYAGSQTVRQFADQNLNWSAAGAGTQGRQLYPRSTASILLWNGWLSSNFHALQLAFNRRFTQGLALRGAYTFSKTIDLTDGDPETGLLWNDPALLSRNRAEAGYSRPHMLQLAGICELPFGKGEGLLSRVIRDWQVNAIFSANSNVPFTVTSSEATLNARENAQTADQLQATVEKLGGIGAGNPYFNPAAFSAVNRVPGVDCSGYDCYGNSGRNILRGPAWFNLDLSLARTAAIRENLNLEFRAEFFNFTNTPHFNNPESDVNSSHFMTITSTSPSAPERVVRVGLRVRW